MTQTCESVQRFMNNSALSEAVPHHVRKGVDVNVRRWKARPFVDLSSGDSCSTDAPSPPGSIEQQKLLTYWGAFQHAASDWVIELSRQNQTSVVLANRAQQAVVRALLVD
jgi:hypothetical protein